VTWTRCCIAGGLALLVLTSAPQLEAQEHEARSLFTRGNEALAAGRRHEALALFLRSLELFTRPSTILNVAQCYRLIDFPEQALRYYQDYLNSHVDPAAPVPYRAEVREHLGRLKVQRELLHKIRELQREGAHKAALKRLKAAGQLTRWPGVDLLRVRSHLALRKTAPALAAARRARAVYERHLQRWRAAGIGPAPRHAQRAAEESQRLVQQLEAEAGKEQPLTTREPARQRSRGWLIAGIVTGALAITAEIVALVYYQKANRLFTDDPTFDTYRSVVIGGHVTAGVLAAFAGTSFVLHFTLTPNAPSGEEARGALVTATLRF
jgi:tetratricopeptide (TPR) repeat protein